jgi:hypothetical protein
LSVSLTLQPLPFTAVIADAACCRITPPLLLPSLSPQVSALFANPWLEHMECHELLAAVAGVLVELRQYEQQAAGSTGSSTSGTGLPFHIQLQELFSAWSALEMRR